MNDNLKILLKGDNRNMRDTVTQTDFMMLASIIIGREAHNMGLIDDETYKTFLMMNLDTIEEYSKTLKGVNEP